MELDDLKQILGVFREEAREIAEKMTGDLLALENAQSAAEAKPLLESLFRGAHTLKGGAGSLGIDDVVGLAHAVESLFGQCQRGERKFVPEFTDAVLASLDEVGKRLDEVMEGKTESSGSLAATQARLTKIVAGEQVDAETTKARAGEQAATGETVLKVGMDRIEAFANGIDEFLVTRLRMAQRTAETQRLAHALEAMARTSAKYLRTEELLELRRLAREASNTARDLNLETQYLAALSDDLRESLRGLQVIPASSVLDPFRRSVRDHARKVNVEVGLDIVGAEVTADRRILEGLRGPLVHLLRNAVDHGIESPDERRRAKKSARARIRVEVAVVGSQLSLVVADDGRGMDAKRIRQVAVEKGVITASEAETMSDEAALALVWRSGFSTAQKVTDTSGRGVGLDAVRDQVTALGGRIDVSSRLGSGTTFKIYVPLMLAAAVGLAVEALGAQYVIPLVAIEGVRRLRMAELERVKGMPVVSHGGKAIPVVSLGGALAGKPGPPAGEEDRPLACIVSDGEAACAFVVDRVDGEREIAIRPLSPELQRYEHFAGATRGADGRVVLVLSPAGIVRRALEVARVTSETEAAPSARTVLVVEDAVTSRLLYRGFLEAAGYTVLLAGDGEEALEILGTGRRVDAIISDVRMPRMDGLELCRRIRRMAGHEETPVMLVTSLGSDEDRREGLHAGATAYLVKTETPPEKVIDVLGGFLP